MFKFLAVVSLFAGGFFASPAFASQKATLLLVPREDGPVRVGMDIGNRYPTLLVSYKMLPNGSVSLHGWSGSEWVNVTYDSYKEGNFFTTAPTSALIVGRDGQIVPDVLIPSEAWCPSVYVISTSETRPLVHLIGRHYDFKYNDWKWFSDNYHLPLNDINPEGLNVAWYHRRLGENLKRNRASGNSDLQYLAVVRTPQVDMEDMPAELPDETVSSPEEISEPVDEETADASVDNPLTNSVPQAVILSAGDAEEAAESPPETGENDEETMDQE